MTITQIRYFLAVCKHQNYTKAAAEMFVSQPTISQAIHDMEAECGVPLFSKEGSRAVLTEAGKILQEEAESLMSQYDRFEKVVKTSHLTRNYLRIGFSTFSGNEVMPKLTERYHEAYPDVRIETMEGGTDSQLRLLQEKRIDLVITSATKHLKSGKYPDLNYMDLQTFRMLYFVSKNSPLANRTGITMKEVAKTPLVVLKDSYPVTQNIKAAFRELDLEPNIILHTSQMFTLLRFITFNAAGGFAPANLVDTNPEIRAIPVVDGPFEPSNTVQLLWNKNAMMIPVIRNFIDVAKDLYGNS